MFVPPLESIRSIAALSAALSLVRLWNSTGERVEVDDRAAVLREHRVHEELGGRPPEPLRVVRRHRAGAVEDERDVGEDDLAAARLRRCAPRSVPASAVSVAFQFLTLKIA